MRLQNADMEKTCLVTHRHCLSSPLLLASSTQSYYPQKWLSRENTKQINKPTKTKPQTKQPLPTKNKNILNKQITHTKKPQPKKTTQKNLLSPNPPTNQKNQKQKASKENPNQSKREYLNCFGAKASTLIEAGTEASLS